MTAAPEVLARFWAKVEKTETCWLWTAAKNEHGYGLFTLDGKRQRAHRLVFEFSGQAGPGELFVDHICRNRACVNPAHLRFVTNRENLLEPRSQSPGRINRDKTTCRQGHPLKGDNLMRTQEGKRKCRACHAETCRQRYINRKAGIPPLPPGRPKGGTAA